MRFLDVSRIRTRFDERITTADGIELSVDLYLPPTVGSYPVLLHRTPADNNRAGRAGISLAPAERWKAWAALGYIVAAADVRGRGDSEGEFVPFVHEAADGVATVAWLRTLKECNGKIGLWGTGYGAFCAWAAAVAGGHVDAIASVSPFGRVGKDVLHRGGAIRLDWLFWMHLIGGRTVQPPNVPPWSSIHRHLPLATMDEALGREDIWWREWLAHWRDDDPLWAPLNVTERIRTLGIPGLHVTGWWDGQINTALEYYEAACQSGAPQRLIVGPWDTAGVRRPQRMTGGFDFGPRSVLDLDETLIEFFDDVFRASDARAPPEARLFVTGRNEWVTGAGWSGSSPNVQTFYLDSIVAANTRAGDGTLSRAPAAQPGVDVITHNPAVPVEFQPQFISFATGANPSGFTADQAHITARDEALVYTSAPLEQPLTVYGNPKIIFTLRTTAADADLYVLLSDCFPLGSRDLHLSHAAIRLGTRDAFEPGKPIEVELELDALAHEFLAGHQLRLTLTPSLFPLYARNLHGKDYIGGEQMACAHIELHHGPDTKARLLLPVVVDRAFEGDVG